VCAKNAERVMQGFEGGKWRIGREDFGAPGGDRTHEYWFCRAEISSIISHLEESIGTERYGKVRIGIDTMG
jgi:hypothetical protein